VPVDERLPRPREQVRIERALDDEAVLDEVRIGRRVDDRTIITAGAVAAVCAELVLFALVWWTRP
jgi:hypothetical protein